MQKSHQSLGHSTNTANRVQTVPNTPRSTTLWTDPRVSKFNLFFAKNYEIGHRDRCTKTKSKRIIVKEMKKK